MLSQFAFVADAGAADALSDALLQAGALAVAVDDADAQIEAEQPLFGDPGGAPAATLPIWPRNRLQVLCGPATDRDQILAAACERLGIPLPAIESITAVADDDWVRLTQSQFPPTHVAGRLWVVPTWHEPPDATALNIRLDPGAAFGTGTHPTTRLCLAWLAEHMVQRAGARVLDYGCGSGILSIGAALLGAGEIYGTDVDPKALVVAADNAARNGITLAHYTAPDRLPQGAPGSPTRQFDVVLANILAVPLILLAPSLLARLAPHGALVLSGILEHQADSLRDAYARAGRADGRSDFALDAWRVDEGWVCMTGRFGAPA
jgi:ribosomal protein L11 methyltransferase